MEKVPESVKYAVNWWLNQLRGKPKFDNGDNSINSTIASGLATILREGKNDISEEKLEELRNTLTHSIINGLSNRSQISLHVDYDPTGILADAFDSCSVDSFGRLPWKTMMVVTKDFVELSDGYAKPFEKVFGG